MGLEVLLVCAVAFGASWLTLISGFGLGTLLLPVFILFFNPLEALAMTAVVHFLNNLFKFSLLYKQVNKTVLLYFGVTGMIGAAFGAKLSLHLTDAVAYSHVFLGEHRSVSYFSTIVGGVMILFALQELLFGKVGFAFKRGALIPGGAISGFFGGLSGHQGALRSMFLLKAGLTPKVYVATGTAIALLVDVTRIPLYINRLSEDVLQGKSEWLIVSLATLSAFAGAYIGKRMIEKVTFRSIQWIVGSFMIAIGALLLTGVLG